jgi:capsular exopolysaccharide synthesis family protein
VANSRAQVGLVGLQQKADATKQIYEAYLNRAKEVAAAGSFQQPDASVASAAALPMRPVSPNMKMAFALAVFLGVVGGAASILVAELWDRGLRSRNDVERDLGVPFAGVLPDFETISTKRGGPAAPADYLVNHPFSSFAEAFRNLRAFLMLAHRSGPAKLVAITSAVPREGKSMTSFCLARTLALSGSRVVLVDCDVRQRGVTKLLGGADIGVAEVIQNKATLADAIVRDPKTTLWVLPAGGTGEIPYDLFSREETDQLLRDLCEQFDYVVLDTPPVLGVADARILAARADRVLYVVQWNKTPVRAAQSGIDTLHESGANVAGALLSKVNVRQQARYGYGDSSDYFHYYRDYYITAA